MDKRIIQRAKYLKERGAERIVINSNAELMTEAIAEQLLASGLDHAHFSIESVDKETLEGIRVGLHLERVVEGIMSFVRARERIGAAATITLIWVYWELNRDQYGAFREFWRERLRPGDDILLCPRHSFGALDVYQSATSTACFQIFNSMHVRADGKATLCCVDVDGEYKTGDAATASLLDCFNSDVIWNDRHRHLMGLRREMKICDECDQPESSQASIRDQLEGPAPALNGQVFVHSAAP